MISVRLSTLFLLAAVAPALAAPKDAQPGASPCQIALPNKDGSVRFAVAGDAGSGANAQRDVAGVMAACHKAFEFDIVIMPGDNLYGSEDPKDYRRKFEEPYKTLLDAGVKFYAALGNHDEPEQRLYKNFNMNGERYYKFEKDDVAFFALDSTYMTPEQLKWMEKELTDSKNPWKIVFFHHPIYSSGARHGSDLELRKVLEPLFVNHGVDVVFAGHEHFYERLTPQKEIQYFISGAAGKLRKGGVDKSPMTAAFFDQDNSFMLVEILGDTMYFQSISRSGRIVDQGQIIRREAPKSAPVTQSDQRPEDLKGSEQGGAQAKKQGETP